MAKSSSSNVTTGNNQQSPISFSGETETKDDGVIPGRGSSSASSGSSSQGQSQGGQGQSQAESGQVQEAPQSPVQNEEQHEIAQTQAPQSPIQHLDEQDQARPQQTVTRPGDVNVSTDQLNPSVTNETESNTSTVASGYEENPELEQQDDEYIQEDLERVTAPIVSSALTNANIKTGDLRPTSVDEEGNFNWTGKTEKQRREQKAEVETTFENLSSTPWNDDFNDDVPPSSQSAGVHERTDGERMFEDNPVSARFYESSEIQKENAHRLITNKRYNGDAVLGIMVADDSIEPNQIGVGAEIIKEAIAAPNSNFIRMLNRELNANFDPSTVTFDEIRSLINKSNLEVVTGKSPISRTASTQRRVLRIVDGHGISIHPLQAKPYNADFDSDKIAVQFRWGKDKRMVHSAMDFLIDIDGRSTIDADRFLMPYLKETDPDDVQLLEDVLEPWKNNMLRHSNRLIPAIINTSQNVNDNDAWVNLIRTVQDTSDHDSQVISDIFNAIYKAMKDESSLRIILAESREEFESDYIMPESPIDQAFLDMTDQARMGKVPKNFQDFKRIVTRYTGEIKDNNVSFRISAEIAKIIKWDQRIYVGNDNLAEFYAKTMEALYSMNMSHVVTFGDKQKYAAEVIRTMIISDMEIGLPYMYREPGQGGLIRFIRRFSEAYRRAGNMARGAGFKTLTDFTLKVDEDQRTGMDINKKDLTDIARAFVNVYGDYNLQTLFGDGSDPYFGNQEKNEGIKKILDRYKDATLREFALNNTIYVKQEDVKKIKKRNAQEYKNETALFRDLLLLVADRKTSRASKYNKMVTGDKGIFSNMQKLLKEINTISSNQETEDWQSWVDHLAELVFNVSPDVFAYYKMDYVRQFLNSKYGQALLRAETSDAVGGIYESMLIEYRLSRAKQAIRELQKEKESNNSRSEKYSYYINKYSMELDELASSSKAWETIVREYRATKSSSEFTKIKNRVAEGKQPLITSKWPHYKNWKDLDHDSLIDVLLDINIGYKDKNAILADVAREVHNDRNVMQFQIGYQLQEDPSATYANIGFDADGGIFDTFKNFKKGVNKYEKTSYKEAREEVDRAYELWESSNEKYSLFTMLRELDQNPSSLVSVHEDLYIDAVLSVMDKTFDNSEKSKQQPGPSSLYQGLSYAISGGEVLLSDLDRSDNMILGLRQKDQLNLKDLVHILADGNAGVWSYDELGKPVRITRSALLGIPETEIREDHIWNWLKEHPRKAMSLRGHQVNVIADRDAKAFLSAKHDGTLKAQLYKANKKTEDQRRRSMFSSKVRLELMDRYGFGALIGLFTPMQGNVSRNVRSTAKQVRRQLQALVNKMAAMKQRGENLAWPDALERNITLLNGEKFNTEYLIKLGVEEREAKELISEICNNLDFYAERVFGIAKECGYLIKPSNEDISLPNPDLSSCAAYYDVKQELCGAKTARSTGIEGMETHKLAFWTALYGPVDEYDDLGKYDPQDIIFNLIGGRLLDGTVIDNDNVQEIIDREMKSEEELIVRVPDNFAINDETLDDHGANISSLNRWVMIKRDDGAEKLNLKRKKLGDDGTDSITKFYDRKTDTSWLFDSDKTHDYVFGNIKTVYEENNRNIEAAYEWLAKYLKKCDEDLGYNDAGLHNCMNRAKELLVEKDGQIYLRSWKQIVYAIKHRIPSDIIQHGSPSDIRNSERAIAEIVGTEEFVGDPATLFDKIKVAGSSEFSPVLREQSSSWHRDFALLSEISKATKIAVMGDKEANQISKANAEKSKLAESVVKDANYYVLDVLKKDKPSDIPQVKNISIGKQFAYVIEASAGPIDLTPFRERGNTVFVEDPSYFDAYPENIANFCRNNLIQVDDKLWALPFFDILQNGWYSDGKLFGKAGSFAADDESVTFLTEDTTGEWGTGDSQVQFFESLINRINIDWSDVESIPVSDLFADTIEFYRNKNQVSMSFSLASDTEIQQYVLQQTQPFTLDYGASAQNRSFGRIQRNVDDGIKKYIERSNERDQNGILNEGNKPNDVIAWARCDIFKPSGVEHVLAPIQPWRIGSSLTSPVDYSVSSLGYNRLTSCFDLGWAYSGDPTKAVFKFYDGSSASNKMVGAADQVLPSPMLRNGIPLDASVYFKSTANRRLGTNKRMDTLVTMWFVARRPPYGYNFANCDDAFPDDADLKERVASEYIPISEWPNIHANVTRYSSDPYLNAFIKKEVGMCIERGINPSDFLGSTFGGKRSRMYFEFKTIMEESFDYQNALLNYFHHMMPTLCPDNIEGEWKNCLFRPCRKDDPIREAFNGEFDIGCMQMQVPHQQGKNGKVKYVWQNVYASFSFFGEEYTGFHRPNVNGASKMNDQLNALALHGRIPWGMDFRAMVQWAASDVAYDIDRNGSLSADARGLATTKEDGE